MNYLKRQIIINKIKKGDFFYRTYKNLPEEYQNDFKITRKLINHKAFYNSQTFCKTIASNYEFLEDYEKGIVVSNLDTIIILYPDIAKKIIYKFSTEFLIKNYQIPDIEKLYSDSSLIEVYLNIDDMKIKNELFGRIKKSEQILELIFNNIKNIDKIIEIYYQFYQYEETEKIIRNYFLNKISKNEISIEKIIKLININPKIIDNIQDENIKEKIINKIILDYSLFEKVISINSKYEKNLIHRLMNSNIVIIQNIVNNINYDILKKLTEISPSIFQYIIKSPRADLINENKEFISEYNNFENFFKYYTIATIKGNRIRNTSTFIRGNSFFEKNNQIFINDSVIIDNCELLNEIDYNLIFYCIDQLSYDKREDSHKCDLIIKALIKIYNEDTFNKLLPSIKEIIKHFDSKFYLNQYNYMYEENKYCFKLLFNKEIIDNNTPELINSFIYDFLNKNNDSKKKFYKIIENTYGEKAIKILKSRPGLNLLTISSLEVFRPEILNNFSEGFVHDLLSYDINGFNAFLIIIKNKEDLELYKEYYNIMSTIYGENVTTMQKTFSNFYYVKELLKDAFDKQLTEKHQQQFLTILCGDFNVCNINSITDLDKYDKMLNQDLMNKIKSVHDLEEIKQILFENLFSLNSADYYYYMSIPSSDINEELYINLTENEKIGMNILDYIKKSKNVDELKLFVLEILKENNIRNPKSIISLLKKIKKNEINLINKKQGYLTDQKITELTKNRLIEQTQAFGVNILIYDDLEKLDVCFNWHHTYLSYDEIITLESSVGCSTISTHADKPSNPYIGAVYFKSIPEDTEIVTYSKGDGGVSGQRAKCVYSTNMQKIENYNNGGKSLGNGEIAFFRRYRDHKKISSDNYGGKIIPDLIFEISDSNIALAQKYGITILCSREQFDKYVEAKRNEKYCIDMKEGHTL